MRNLSVFIRWQVWLIILILLIVILGITWFLTGSSGFPAAFPDAIVAWGTLTLAFVAFWSILKTREENIITRKENEHIRKEERAENRRLIEEERERALNKFVIDKIYNWAKQINEFMFLADVPDKMDRSFAMAQEILNFKLQLLDMQQYARIFGDKVVPFLNKVRENLNEFTESLWNIRQQAVELSSTTPSEDILKAKSNVSIIRNVRDATHSSLMALLTVLIDLRIELKL